jgi:hypothetical protein
MLTRSSMLLSQAAGVCKQWGGGLAAFADEQQSSAAAVLLPTGGGAWIGLVADPNASATRFAGQPLEWPQYWDINATATGNSSSAQKLKFVPSAGFTGRLFYATTTPYFDRHSGGIAYETMARGCSCYVAVEMQCAHCQVARCTLLLPDGSWRSAPCDGTLLMQTPLLALCQRAAPPSNECELQNITCRAAAAAPPSNECELQNSTCSAAAAAPPSNECELQNSTCSAAASAPPSNECELQNSTCTSSAAAECVDTPGSYYCNCS